MRRSRISSLLLLVAAGSFASCSDDDGSSTDTSDSTTGADSTATAASPTTAATETTPATAAPGAETTVADPATAAPPTSEPASTYTVVAGDSLSRIGDLACMSLAELVAANGWTDGIAHVLQPGEVVQITPGACDPVPADYALPYTPPPPRPPSTPECDAALAAYDAVFAGPPAEATEDAARQTMVDAVAQLRAALAPFGELPDVPAALDALAAGEPDLAAAYVAFLSDTTDRSAYDAMQAALEPIGLSRYVIAVQVATACPSA